MVARWSKQLRYCIQWDLQYLETLGPLVVPSLRSGHYSPGPLGFLNTLDPLDTVSNCYVEAGLLT